MSKNIFLLGCSLLFCINPVLGADADLGIVPFSTKTDLSVPFFDNADNLALVGNVVEIAAKVPGKYAAEATFDLIQKCSNFCLGEEPSIEKTLLEAGGISAGCFFIRSCFPTGSLLFNLANSFAGSIAAKQIMNVDSRLLQLASLGILGGLNNLAFLSEFVMQQCAQTFLTEFCSKWLVMPVLSNAIRSSEAVVVGALYYMVSLFYTRLPEEQKRIEEVFMEILQKERAKIMEDDKIPQDQKEQILKTNEKNVDLMYQNTLICTALESWPAKFISYLMAWYGSTLISSYTTSFLSLITNISSEIIASSYAE
jgi:hypothetical protein